MCQLFIGANQDCWKNITRSLRIDGVTTSIRLEHFFLACIRRNRL
ncbi:ribbon-helix-helix domain-containing protein [Pseudoalteromonas phenolica]